MSIVVIKDHQISVIEVSKQGPPGPAGQAGSGTGSVFITDIQPTSSGIVSLKTFEPGSVPANINLLTASTDTTNIRVFIVAEGGSVNYTPTVTVEGVGVSLTEDANDKRHYTGFADITISATGDITALSNTGGDDTVTVTLLGAGPSITSFTHGLLPGSQTEAKAGDSVPVSGTVPNEATAISILDFGAADSGSISLGAIDSAGIGFRTFSGNIIVSSSTGALASRAEALNSFGTAGPSFDTTNTITLNQTFPSFIDNGIIYPVGQEALKDNESADVEVIVNDFDQISYSSTTLSIPSPTAYSAIKTVSRSSGNYVNSGTNYQISATRDANGATSVYTKLVVIQHLAPTASISIDGAPSKLRSSPTGLDYTVRITPNQELQGTPSMSASIGTFLGSWIADTGNTWIRNLRILDSDSKGPGLFNSLILPGLSNRDGSAITMGSTYISGGFTKRTLTFAAFSQLDPIGTEVYDISKTEASYTGSSILTLFPDTNEHFQGYTITDSGGLYDPTGDHLFLTDSAFAGSNTTGTLQVDIEEVL